MIVIIIAVLMLVVLIALLLALHEARADVRQQESANNVLQKRLDSAEDLHQQEISKLRSSARLLEMSRDEVREQRHELLCEFSNTAYELDQVKRRFDREHIDLGIERELRKQAESKLAEIRQLQYKGATVHTYGCHVAPDQEFLKANEAVEPEGERLRRELTAWLKDSKIVSAFLDTEGHTIQIDNAPPLPPAIKSVLTNWGAITVVDEDPLVRPREWKGL